MSMSKFWVAALGSAAVIAGALYLAPMFVRSNAPPVAVQAQEAPAAETRQVPATRTEMQLSFAPVVKSVTPSVVNVYATTITQQSSSPMLDDPFFRRFFGRN